MPVSLTVADVIDKNKIASENAWLILIDVDIKDSEGRYLETLSFVRNNENIEYQGVLYTATDFNIDFSRKANEEPSMKFSANDVSGVIREKMEDYDGGVGFEARMTVVNSGNLDADPELEEIFEITDASAPDTTVEWTLGAENPLRYEYPLRSQYRDRCGWLYRGRRCKYSGSMPSCDFTKDGPNGCAAHGNKKNFGAFPSLKSH